jgi:hypothetical protein
VTPRAKRGKASPPAGQLAREARALGGRPLTSPHAFCREAVRFKLGGDIDRLVLVFELPKAMRLRSEQNMREHWSVTGRRAKHHRNTVGFAVAWLLPFVAPRYEVTMVRLIGPRGQQLDSDGLVASCKHVRDGVADALGIDDRDPRVSYACRQERSSFHGVRVTVQSVRSADAFIPPGG